MNLDKSGFQNEATVEANIIHVVPAMAASIVKFPDRLKYDVSSVRYIVAAAAPMGVSIETQLRDLFKLDFVAILISFSYRPHTAYGLSETGHNSETEEELSRNKTGEIRIRGPMVSPGYLDDEDATRNALDLKGYFKTGDLGYLDADGYLFIVDRLKELIKYNGLQVAPAYLEDIIVKHPDVVDAAVIGIPDPDAGELPRAYVVRQPGSQTTTKDIIQYVHDHVAPHMRLRGGVEFIEEVPRTPSGKIMRRLLKTRKQCLSKL
ncbi:4CLL5-like protein [Mya arenaria]|uniref:4CLL5-like protein n=1 Tax=Mya arenaria TaxID=6604 RepID=A0ABY7F1H7_MYAAR|nr:4CLL5-like protein [Mya arenaria]